jgi:hypothetical protein
MAGNLDKAGRLAREKAAREAELRKRVQRLDPKFPYRVIAFDTGFFRAQPTRGR